MANYSVGLTTWGNSMTNYSVGLTTWGNSMTNYSVGLTTWRNSMANYSVGLTTWRHNDTYQFYYYFNQFIKSISISLLIVCPSGYSL